MSVWGLETECLGKWECKIWILSIRILISPSLCPHVDSSQLGLHSLNNKTFEAFLLVFFFYIFFLLTASDPLDSRKAWEWGYTSTVCLQHTRTHTNVVLLPTLSSWPFLPLQFQQCSWRWRVWIVCGWQDWVSVAWSVQYWRRSSGHYYQDQQMASWNETEEVLLSGTSEWLQPLAQGLSSWSCLVALSSFSSQDETWRDWPWSLHLVWEAWWKATEKRENSLCSWDNRYTSVHKPPMSALGSNTYTHTHNYAPCMSKSLTHPLVSPKNMVQWCFDPSPLHLLSPFP